ncbi:MAG: hypothetical protein GY864_14900 [Desulfobacterales bacterium]|nr:hypothetical protein [Desulfobacterales bacterium]
MKQVKRDLQSLLNALKAINQKVRKISTEINKLEKAQASKKPKAKAAGRAKPAKKAAARRKSVAKKAKKRVTRKPIAKKGKKVSASETVYAIIKRTKKGIDTATLKKRTGFKDDNIRMIVYRLKKQKKIKSGGRGIYKKA